MGVYAKWLPFAVLASGNVPLVDAQDYAAAGPTWNQSSYSSSPPVYPSPNMTGAGWEAAYQQAYRFVAQLTLEEKAGLVTGEAGPCVGNIPEIPRLGFKGLCLMDGPLAIRQADYASAFPAGLTVAASWDRDLAHKRGYDMAMEFKEKGAHIALGPVAGPLGRSAYGGRNWEGFSPDPFLTGELFEESIIGMQETGVQAVAKHYIGNEQETQRYPDSSKVDPNIRIEAVSSNIDDRTLHELYLWPFQNAVKAGVSSVMCSYNRINASYACQNSKLLNGILKDELGFQGYVMSDWGGTHSGWPAIEAGEDMDMPGITFVGTSYVRSSYFGGNITRSVNNGSLSEDRLDDMCRRIMTPYFHFNQADYPTIDGSTPALGGSNPADYNYTYNLGPSNIDVRGDHAELIRELGAAGIVLLKNENNTLPLKTPKNVGVFGNDAGDITIGLYFGADSDLLNIGFEYGVLPVGGGSGTARMSYVVPPLDAIKRKVASYDDKALVQYVLNNTEVIEAGGFNILYPPPEVCLVFLKTWATEGYDRSSLLVDWDGTALVNNVSSQCSNTIVVTHSGGLNVLPFADNPNVTAILAAHYGGEQVGNSIVDVLWGDVNPSGRLPYTIAKNEKDYDFADITNSTKLIDTTDPNAWQSNFKERLLIDYRWFDYFNESVQYEFGYGLSYTTFSMSDVTVQSLGTGALSALPTDQKIVPGGNPDLWENVYCVTATVTNTGSVAGAAVPQLYLGLPQPPNQDTTPKRVLRGFEKVMLQPGESQSVKFDLTRRDISYWDIVAQQWTILEGAIDVFAGFSSRDVQGTSSFTPLG